MSYQHGSPWWSSSTSKGWSAVWRRWLVNLEAEETRQRQRQRQRRGLQDSCHWDSCSVSRILGLTAAQLQLSNPPSLLKSTLRAFCFLSNKLGLSHAQREASKCSNVSRIVQRRVRRDSRCSVRRWGVLPSARRRLKLFRDTDCVFRFPPLSWI